MKKIEKQSMAEHMFGKNIKTLTQVINKPKLIIKK